MKVKDMILYQVATDKNYKVGDKLHFGDKPNGQYFATFDSNFSYNGKGMHELGWEYAKSKNIFKNKDIIYKMSETLSHYDFCMREFALEEVRRTQFPNLPSRFTCMFLSDNQQTCLNNISKVAGRGKGQLFQAIKVKVTGTIHVCKDVGIGRDGLSFNEYKKLAEKYWSQKPKDITNANEILFEGDAMVIEILEEYSKN